MTEYELDEYRMNVSYDVTKHIFEVVQEETKKHGDMFGTELALTIMSSMIATIVKRSLAMSEIDQMTYTAIKHAMELSVANGFESGLRAAGKPEEEVDTICRVHTFEKPYNKLPA